MLTNGVHILSSVSLCQKGTDEAKHRKRHTEKLMPALLRSIFLSYRNLVLLLDILDVKFEPGYLTGVPTSSETLYVHILLCS